MDFNPQVTQESLATLEFLDSLDIAERLDIVAYRVIQASLATQV